MPLAYYRTKRSNVGHETPSLLSKVPKVFVTWWHLHRETRFDKIENFTALLGSEQAGAAYITCFTPFPHVKRPGQVICDGRFADLEKVRQLLVADSKRCVRSPLCAVVNLFSFRFRGLELWPFHAHREERS